MHIGTKDVTLVFSQRSLPPALFLVWMLAHRCNEPSFLSVSFLQVLDKTEAARAESPQVRAKQQQLQAKAQLPSAFDILRVIFGVRGSCLRPKDEVVAALRDKSSSRGGVTLADAQLQVSTGRWTDPWSLKSGRLILCHS